MRINLYTALRIKRFALILGSAFLLAATFLPTGTAEASCPCCSCGSINGYHGDTRSSIKDHFDGEMENHQKWLKEEFWVNHVRKALMDMTEQFTATALLQMEILGTFFDAKLHMDTQRTFQELQARAHKDYMPSQPLCQFGTFVRSVADAEQAASSTKLVMNSYAMDRQLGKPNILGSGGSGPDLQKRLQQFRETYCDIRDNGGKNGLEALCFTSAPAERRNRDVDYTRLVDMPKTLQIKFNDPAEAADPATPDEEDILSLMRNLYAHRIVETRLTSEAAKEQANHDDYLALRSVIAKRNVAMNSFLEIAAMKSEGSGASRPYLKSALQKIGMPPANADELLGARPSYDAQMEFLTKHIYQDPAFVVNLVDKPANVDRQITAMQSFNLMQQRDIFDSLLRTEMLLSILLEMQLIEDQKEIEGDIDDLPSSG